MQSFEHKADNNLTEQEWLDLHKSPHVVTASQVSTILGENPFESAFTLFQKKLGRVPWGDEAIHMRAGKALEPLVDSLYQEHTGRKTVNFGEFTVDTHPDVPLVATLDRFDDDERCVELKTANQFARQEWMGTDGPLHYQLQAQSQIACCQLDRGALACLVGNREFFHHDFDRHDKIIRVIEIKVTEFVERLKADDPPPLDASASTMRSLAFLHPKDDGSEIERDDLESLVQEWALSKEQVKQAEDERDAIANQLKAAFGDATFMRCGKYVLSYKHQHRKEHTVKASDFRVLRLT